MHKHYQLLNVNDLKHDESSILEILASIRDKRLRSDIRLLNYYRELPIYFDAVIEGLDRGSVEMRVHDLQAAAMMLEKETFIKSDHLSHDVIAKVLKVEKDRNVAILGSFQYVLITAERRLNVRVKVSEKYDATFHNKAQLIHGHIEDISFGGISISTPKGSIMEENSKGVVNISLPNTKLEAHGKLIKINESESAKSYVIELEVDSRSERLISQFIFSQQSKIIRELKDFYSRGPNR
jgi:c-di-GMP-binding flagellar brake protein YcgR